MVGTPEVPRGLIQKAKAGDVSSRNEIIRLTRSYVARCVLHKYYGLFPEIDELEGIISDGIWKSMEVVWKFKGLNRCTVTSWMVRVCINHLLDERRKYWTSIRARTSCRILGNGECEINGEPLLRNPVYHTRDQERDDDSLEEEVYRTTMVSIKESLLAACGDPRFTIEGRDSNEGRILILARYVDGKMLKKIAREFFPSSPKGSLCRKMKEWRDILLPILANNKKFIQALEILFQRRLPNGITQDNICDILEYVRRELQKSKEIL